MSAHTPGPRRRRDELLAAAFVALVAASALPTGGAVASGTAPVVSDHRGDVVTLSLSLGNATDATVQVDGPDGSGYRANLTVVDRDEDGRVRLRWNTYLAGHGGGFLAVGSDRVRVRGATAVDGRVPTGRYSVTATVDGEVVDDVTVRLSAPTAPSLRTLVTLPGRNATLDSPAAVRRGERAGRLRELSNVTRGETLVLALRAPGIEGALAAHDAPNASARFANLTASGRFAFSFEQDSATVGLEELPESLAVAGPGVHLLADPANDTYYLVVDVDRARTTTDRRQRDGLEEGERFDARFSVLPASGLVDEPRNATARSLLVVEPRVELAAPATPLVRPRENQVLSAETTLPAGSRVTVRVEVLASGFERTRTVTVTRGPAGNRVNATLNLSAVRPDRKLLVSYFLAGEPIGDGLSTDPQRALVTDDRYALSVLAVERGDDGPPTVRVNATLGRPGFVVLHADTPRGRVLGVTDLLRDGTHANLSVRVTQSLRDADRVVAVLHDYDTDDAEYERPQEYEGDPAVVLNGTRLFAAADVPPERTPTSSPTATPTPSPSPTASPTMAPTPTPTAAKTPGLGLLATLAAVCLAAATLVAAGRRCH